MIYRLVNWLFGERPSTLGKVRRWQRLHPWCNRMWVPAGMFIELLAELRFGGICLSYEYDPLHTEEEGFTLFGVLVLPDKSATKMRGTWGA